MVEKFKIEQLLELNPEAKAIFEQNQRKVEAQPKARRDGRVAVPYGGRFVQPDDARKEIDPKARRSFSRV